MVCGGGGAAGGTGLLLDAGGTAGGGGAAGGLGVITGTAGGGGFRFTTGGQPALKAFWLLQSVSAVESARASCAFAETVTPYNKAARTVFLYKVML